MLWFPGRAPYGDAGSGEVASRVYVPVKSFALEGCPYIREGVVEVAKLALRSGVLDGVLVGVTS